MSVGGHKDMRAVIYAKDLAGKSAQAQVSALRRLCQRRGWTVGEVYIDPPGRPQKLESSKGRLAMLDVLLGRRSRIGVECVWQ